MKKAKTQKVLYITYHQLGCPTNAYNFAKFIIEHMVLNNKDYNIHHFADKKAMTWYDFAKKILKENNLDKKVKLEKVRNCRTFARRFKNSVLT